MRLASMIVSALAVLAIGIATVNDPPRDNCEDPIFTEHTVTVTCYVDGQAGTHTAVIPSWPTAFDHEGG